MHLQVVHCLKNQQMLNNHDFLIKEYEIISEAAKRTKKKGGKCIMQSGWAEQSCSKYTLEFNSIQR